MVTLTSSFFTPEISALIRYAASVSLMSIEGDQSATANISWPDSARAVERPKIRFKRLETSSNSLKGSHLIKFMIVLLCDELHQNNHRATGSQPDRTRRFWRWRSRRSCLPRFESR